MFTERPETTNPSLSEPDVQDSPPASAGQDEMAARIADRFERSEPSQAESPLEEGPPLQAMPGGQNKPFYRRNPVTTLFVLLLVGVYALTSFPNHFQAPTDLAVAVGGFYPPAVWHGEWWRYITATLMHGNPGHLFNNAAGLLIFGNLLEPVIGSLRLMGLYVVSALAGLVLSYYLLPKGLTIGASTIDYGLIGAYLALILLVRFRSDRQAFFREFRGALFFVFLFIGWNTLESTTVNLWGHIGGLIGGVAYAVIIWRNRPKKG